MHKLVRAVLALLLGLAGCAGFEDPAFEDEPTIAQPGTTRTVSEQVEDEPTAEVEPTTEIATPTAEVIIEGPGESGMDTYTSTDGSWSVEYFTPLLQPEQLSGDITLFISEDRSTFFAVDTYHSEEYEFGNTGEGLRNRARLTASIIYGKDVEMVDVLENPTGTWEMGITFKTEGGSEGEALYEQAGFELGDKQVRGVLYGYKRDRRDDVRPVLEIMRNSFKRIPQRIRQ